MDDNYFKLPRIYTTQSLHDKGVIALEESQAHYLFTVLRRKDGDQIRLFNGQDGEWLANLGDLRKKSGQGILQKQIKIQPQNIHSIHLLFAPIKKHRMDWLIEKAVELGVSDFHPLITQNTQNSKIKTERVNNQIFEAAEQCERLHLPTLHPIKKLDDILNDWFKDIQIMACLERHDGTLLQKIDRDIAVLVGPEGGFTEEEKKQITQKATAITLGEQILRTETAVVKALSLLDG